VFKAPGTLLELEKINSGVFYGYSQVGKFITVYPRSDEDAVFLAGRLHQLTKQTQAPDVPFDFKFRPDGCIYYRYGSFEHLEMTNPDGTRTPALRDRDGKLVADLRDSPEAKPDWVSNPFAGLRDTRRDSRVPQPLPTAFRPFQAMTQRGKGGVYKALDFSVCPPRLCVMKEGRRGGEITWDGRDGHWRVRREEQILSSLRNAGVGVPAVFSSFEAGDNYYLVTEYIDGETLQAFLGRRQRRLPVARALTLGAELSALLHRIHSAGWAWGDCKPDNVIVAAGGKLRPVDFEGTCPVDHAGADRWGTAAFTPRGCPSGGSLPARRYDDLYALGAVVYFMLAGRLPDGQAPIPLKHLRRGIPAKILNLVGRLLGDDLRGRPSAETFCRVLSEAAAERRCNRSRPSRPTRRGARALPFGLWKGKVEAP
jgi:serine/threonine protein kinase